MEPIPIEERRNDNEHRRLFDKMDEYGRDISEIKQKVFNGLDHKVAEMHPKVDTMEKHMVNIMATLVRVSDKVEEISDNMLTKKAHDEIEISKHTIETVKRQAEKKANDRTKKQLIIGVSALGVLTVVAPEIKELIIGVIKMF